MPPDSNVKLKALEIGHSVLRSHDAGYQAKEPFYTVIHLVLPATLSDGREVCIKVRLKAAEAILEDRRVPYNARELKTFQLLDNQHSWVPHLIDFAPDTTWLMRDWFGTETMSELRGTRVPFTTIENVWNVFGQAFAFFHSQQDPWLIRDLTTKNIAMQGDRLALFDFNTTMPLSVVRNGNFPNRLGRPVDSNRYNPPELLTSKCPDADIPSDYFAFATMIYVLLTGALRPFWSNKINEPKAALAQYHTEYEAEIPSFVDRAREAGFDRIRVEFLVACLNPDLKKRPRAFLN